MKLTTLAMAVVTTMAFGHAAEARTHHRAHSYRHVARSHVSAHHRWARHERRRRRQTRYAFGDSRYAFGDSHYAYDDSRYAYGDSHYAFSGARWGGGYGPRPRAWCGWEMRHLVSSDPGPSYNLARNWAHWGHAGAPGIGAVVVWPHHVGKIVGHENGMWVIKSGNDGHELRTRPRSIAGAIAIRWG